MPRGHRRGCGACDVTAREDLAVDLDGDADRALFATGAALLAQGAVFERLSLLLTGAALAGLFLLHGEFLIQALLGVAALCGFGQAYLALRVRFDAALFAALAAGEALPNLRGLDAALAALRLVPATKAGRPAVDRVLGAKGLIVRQAVLVLIQIALTVAGSVIRPGFAGG